ncbi:methyltransferase domain-containing protein, partial [Pantoea eucrina]
DRDRRVTALDLSLPMLDAARAQRSAHHYLQGDIDRLPLADGSVDGVWSNLAVQWSSDLSVALQQFYRVLRPGGTALFSTLLAGSLPEVDRAWAAIDSRRHANRFLQAGEVTAAARAQPLRSTQQII